MLKFVAKLALIPFNKYIIKPNNLLDIIDKKILLSSYTNYFYKIIASFQINELDWLIYNKKKLIHIKYIY